MWESKVANSINRVIRLPAQWGSIIGGIALAAMMIVVVTDIIMRAGISRSLVGSIELVEAFVIVCYFSVFAVVELRKEHIQITVLLDKLRPVVRKVIINSGYILTIAITIVVCWRLFLYAGLLRDLGLTTHNLCIPLWTLVAAAAFLTVLLILSFVVNFLNHLAELFHMIGTRAYSWLLPGIILTAGIFVFSFYPNLIPFECPHIIWGTVLFLLLFVLIFLGIHIGPAMAIVALLGLSYILGASLPSLSNLSLSTVSTASEYTWSVIPLFLWMGFLVFHAGSAKHLYTAAYKWIGRVPGGLASASVSACTFFAALTGDTLPGILTIGVIALPQMRAYKYSDKLATASLCAGSTIGTIIPPSISMIVYGMLTGVSIGKLFIAGIFPGILLSVVLIGMITIMCYRNPKLGPKGPSFSWKERGQSLWGVLPPLMLVGVCLGGLYAGLFTPTEAGAAGCFGAIILGVAMRGLTFKGLVDSMLSAVRISGVMMLIFVFAFAFAHFLALSTLPYVVAHWIVSLGLSPHGVLFFILFIYMVLGCIMASIPAVVITLPIFFPVVMDIGFDPILFGVLITFMIALGNITPPVGMNVFGMAAVVKDVPLYDIFRGVLPFWGAFIVVIVILVYVPEISLFLPNLM